MDVNGLRQPIFGKWYIVEELGSGAFGTVYKIKRESFGKEYFSALKVINIPQNKNDIKSLRKELGDDSSVSDYYTNFVQDFAKEIELMAELKGNSNIVSFEDHDIVQNSDGIGWTILIRMELLTPFVDFQAENDLDNSEIVKLGMDICSALELCEKRNIIHRDIKPDNIFISKDGDYELGDFGIARELEKTTGGLSKKGTYSYMAPEVYLGKPYNNTVDIYSLGIVMYKLLNRNRAPFMPDYPNPITFTDRENALQMRMRGDEIPDIKDIPKVLNDIVKKACAFESKERYQTAGEFKQALLDALNADAPTVNGDKAEYIQPEKETSVTNEAFDDDEKTAGPFTATYEEPQKEDPKAEITEDGEKTAGPFTAAEKVPENVEPKESAENENTVDEDDKTVSPFGEGEIKATKDTEKDVVEDNTKQSVKSIVKLASKIIGAVALVVFIILVAIHLNNMNISNPSGSVDLSTVRLEHAGVELTFKPTDTVNTIIKNNPSLKFRIDYIQGNDMSDIYNASQEESADWNDVDNEVFNKYIEGGYYFTLYAFNSDEGYIFDLYCSGENNTPGQCIVNGIGSYNYDDSINGLNYHGLTAKKAVQQWGAPGKVTKFYGGLFKHLHYYGDNCKIELDTDILGRITYISYEYRGD